MESPQPSKGGAAGAAGPKSKGMNKGMKRCPYCGAKNKSSFEYCIACTEPLDESSPEGAIAQTRSRLNVLVFAGVGGVVGLGILALLAGPSDPDLETSAPPSRSEPAPVRVTPVPGVDLGPAMDSYNAGLAAYRQGDYRTAASEFEKAVREVPDNPGARVYLGLSYYFLEEFENAIPELEEALALRPASFAYLDYLVTSCKKAGELDRATDALRDYVVANPRAIDARVELVRLTRETGDFEESLRVTTRLREEFADDPEFAYEHAATLQAAGRTEEARQALDNALSLAPDDPRAHHALGVIERASGNTSAAVESFEAAVARSPSNGDYLFDLAQGYEKADRVEDSLAVYERYLQHAGPDDARASVVAERLERAKQALARQRRAESSDRRSGPT